MQIEHVAGVGFTAGRAAQQQRDLAIGPGLLGQVVVNDQGVLAAVAEVLAHGAAGVRRDVLHRGGFGSGGDDDDGVFHRAGLLQLADHVLHRGGLLADGDVDAEEVLALLVDDGVDGHRGLAGLAVADDQLALAAADGHHGVDGLEAGLHRLRHRLAPDHAGGDLFDRLGELGGDGALAVAGLAQGVHHAAEHFGTDGHFENAARAFHGIAFGDVLVGAENYRTDGIAFEVQRQAEGVTGEFQHFTLHGVGQAVHAANAVGHGDDRAFGARGGGELQILNLALDQVADFRGVELHV